MNRKRSGGEPQDQADSSGEPLAAIIETEFDFLTELGFRVHSKDDVSVEYARYDGVFVLVFRDPRDNHVGFRVGLQDRRKDALTMDELVRLEGGSMSGPTLERRDVLSTIVARAAQRLRDYGDRVLSGDEAIYQEANERRREYTQRFVKRPSPGRSTSQ